MNPSHADVQTAAKLWRCLEPWKPRLAMLTTASATGVPHATWMGAITTEESGQILTITSPDSRKIANIRENPRVEWLVSELSREVLLYLQGHASIVEEVAEMKQCWNKIPGKTQAYFLQYFNSGPGFAVIRTVVDTAVLVEPREMRKVAIPLESLQDASPPQ